jgi:hypothetical protein
VLATPVLLTYATLLWLTFFGMVAFDAGNPWTRRSKLLGAVTFVVLVVDTVRSLAF